MKKAVILFLFFVSFISFWGQETPKQRLINLLEQGYCFEAQENYNQNKEDFSQNRFLNDYYNFRMSQFYNKPDSSIIYLEKFIETLQNENENNVPESYEHLTRLYYQKQDFKSVMRNLYNLKNYLIKNPFRFDEGYIKESLERVKQYYAEFEKKALEEPRRGIIRDSMQSNIVNLGNTNERHLIFKSHYNDIELNTLFDTGTSYYFLMEKEVADKIGVKFNILQDSLTTLNGQPARIRDGFIDSIKIGNVYLYNILVHVIDEKIRPIVSDSLKELIGPQIRSPFDNADIVIGLPAMKLIGKFEFDFGENTMTLPTDSQQDKEPNIFSYDNWLYTRLKLNGLNFTGYIDLGSYDNINISQSFYEKHRSGIEIDTLTKRKTKNLINIIKTIDYKSPKDLEMIYNGKFVSANDVFISEIMTSPSINYFDGVIGYKFFRKLGNKVLLDLDNMRIDATGSPLPEHEENPSQKLVNLLEQGYCFEAQKYYLKNKLEFSQDYYLDTYYNYRMSQFFNKPDSSIIYLERFIKILKNENGNNVPGFYGHLVNLYYQKQDFRGMMSVMDQMEDYFKKNSLGFGKEYIEESMLKIKQYKADFNNKAIEEPQKRIVRYSIQPNVVNLENTNSGHIFFKSRYNNVEFNTLFDTGSSYYFFMNKETADKIGVKFNVRQDSLTTLNGESVRIRDGWMDSIKIGNVYLYNILVHTTDEKITAEIPDSLKKLPPVKEKLENENLEARVDSTFRSIDIVMGLPAIKLIGKFEFDFAENTMTLPANEHSDKTPNIYVYDNSLYTNLKLNGLNFTGYVDLGADENINISQSFYQKHKDEIEIDTLTEKRPVMTVMINRAKLIDYELPKDLKMKYNDKLMPTKDVIISEIFTSPTVNYFDGVIGYKFFRNLGDKVLFDFDNMRIEAIK
jgi:predicted aspartyl protease